MIVTSLLLILVAVTLLVLGLTGGSSGLLIGSIVASLLAAIALVIGARQTAGARRGRSGADTDDPPAFTAEPADAGRASSGLGDDRHTVVQPAATEPSSSAETADLPRVDLSADDQYAGSRAAAYRDEDPEPGSADEIAWRTEAAVARDAPFGRAEDVSAEYVGRDTPPADTQDSGDSWHDEPAAATDWPGTAASGAAGAGTASSGAATPGAVAAEADADRHARAAQDVPADEFDEAAEDDPADEPLPQAVKPADAVRVARLDAEVLVVDGRPRYHLAECPHLVGRLTEPVPVNEAIELGFTPCGLCRPVDRLVAATARR